jgi:uncharacterized Zn-finger protein
MTAGEAKEMFLARVYAEVSVDVAGWTDEEILEFIKMATMSTVQELSLAETFDLISNLVKTSTEITLTDNRATTPNEYSAPLNSGGITDYLYYVRSRCRVAATTTYVTGEFIQAHEAELYYVTTTHTPYFRHPKVYIEDEKIKVLADSYTVLDKLYLTYVKKPTFAALTGANFTNTSADISDVNISLQEGIIEKAVRLAITSLLTTERSSQ